MKLDSRFSTMIVEELNNTRVEITFSEETYHGYPYYEFWSDTVKVIEEKPREFMSSDGKVIGTQSSTYVPFVATVNEVFHREQDTMFLRDQEYSDYLDGMVKEVLNEIDQNITLRMGKWEIMDYFTVLEMKLKDIKNSFYIMNITCPNTEHTCNYNKRARITSNKIDTLTIPETGDWVLYVLDGYWKLQLTSIDKILQYITIRNAIIEKSDDYVKVISELSITAGLLSWEATDTDLLELITALVESRSIQNHNKSLTRKEAIEIFSGLFNIEIKDAESKLSRATERKKDVAQFLNHLKVTFEDYTKKKEQRLESQRK